MLHTLTPTWNSLSTGPSFPSSIPPAQYDRWRLKSEFFSAIEYPIIRAHLGGLALARILDIGCGTGIWTSALRMLSPQGTLTGIDTDSYYTSYATAKYGSLSFVEASAEAFRDPNSYDLAVAGMSLDYMGMDAFLGCIEANLAPAGTALAWILSPHRYPRVGLRHCRKSWAIDGHVAEVTVEVITPDSLIDVARSRGFAATCDKHGFALADRIWRELLVFRLGRTM